MPSSLATLLTFSGIFYLLWRDARHGEARGPALWIPVLWLCITGSRFVSQWMAGDGVNVNQMEGSPIDVAYFLTLMAAALWVLVRRGVTLMGVIRANGWIMAFFIYGLLSVLWSEAPDIAFKRWVKTLGHPLMALVILTEPDPKAAIVTVLKRCSFVLLPLSVLFIKYLPQYGRGFDPWTGIAINRGVGLSKNDLGYLCMVFGMMWSWRLLTLRRMDAAIGRWREAFWAVAFLAMAVWLVITADSKTSLVTMLVGITAMVAVGLPIVSKRHFAVYVVLMVAIGYGLESAFNLYETIVQLAGRDASLTDRTEVWSDVLGLQTRPLLGFGFESFWLGDRLDRMWAKWWWKPNQAHNGYIETYLNLGLIGLVILGGMLLSTFWRISRQMATDLDFARLRFAFLLAVVVFNYTEAAFKAVHLVWTVFLMISMEAPVRRTEPQLQPALRT